MSKSKEAILSTYFDEYPESASVAFTKNGVAAIRTIASKYQHKHLVKTFNSISPHLLEEALLSLDNTKLARLSEDMQPNLISRVFRSWIKLRNHDKVKSILSLMNPNSSKIVEKLINYSDDVVGSLMNPTPFTVSPQNTIREVLNLLNKKKNRYSRYVCVVDSSLHLLGVLSFKDAFYSNKNVFVSKAMTSDVFSFNPDYSIKDAVKNSNWSKWNAMPVTDSDNILMGAIRLDTLKKHLSLQNLEKEEKEDLINTGKAIGEVFQIGIKATVSVLGLLGSRK